MSSTRLIRTANAIELPAPGRWPLGVAPTVTIGGTGRADGHHAGELSGTLVVGDDLLDVRIEMSMLAPGGAPIELDVTLVDSDAAGRWILSGEVTVAGRTVPVTVEARYHGVFRRGSRAWTELSFGTSVTRATRRRRRLTLDADVIFDAPCEITCRAA